MSRAVEREHIIELLGMEKPLSRSEREIAGLGAAVIPTLISMVSDEDLGAEDHPSGGWAPIHAVWLLGELRAEAAIGPMLDVLRATDWDAIIHDAIIQAMPMIGAPVIEPALKAYDEAVDGEFRSSVASILAECKIRDERIYALLLDRFDAELDDTGLDLASYGDPRALPYLVEAFDDFEIVEGGDAAFANGMLVDLRENIEQLGGTLTVEQEAKFEIAMAPDPSVPQPPAARRERPGRNDVCWCGSKKKYKKCHLESDELAALKN